MLRQRGLTAERTVTRAAGQHSALDSRAAIRERPLCRKGEIGNAATRSGAAMCPAYRRGAMAAGPDEVRGSDPKSPQRARSAWTPWVCPIPGSTGLSSPLTTLAFPLDRTRPSGDLGYMAGAT
jgi:hypothetical protein